MKKKRVNNRIRSHFDSLADTYDDIGGWTRHKSLLEDICSFAKSGLTLEVGVGTGIVSEYLNRSSKGLFCVGIDLSADMCNYAEKKGIPCLVSHAEKTPFRDRIFMNIICRQVLHYVAIGKTLKEWKRVLRPSGNVIISQIVSETIEEFCWWKRAKSLLQPLRRRWFRIEDINIIAEKNHWDVIGIKTRRIAIKRPIKKFISESYLPNVKIMQFLREWQEASPDGVDFRLNKNIVQFNQLWATWVIIPK